MDNKSYYVRRADESVGKCYLKSIYFGGGYELVDDIRDADFVYDREIADEIAYCAETFLGLKFKVFEWTIQDALKIAEKEIGKEEFAKI